MRLQWFIITVLVGLIMWVTAFDAARFVYREAHENGVIENWHIRQKLRALTKQL